MSEAKKATEIGPEVFFDLEHPEDPYVDIEFRTSPPSNPDNPDSAIWENIVFDGNNFFDTLKITDESGFQELELTLQDRDYVNIENIILRTIMNSRVEAWTGMANPRNKEKYDKSTNSMNNAPSSGPEKNTAIMKNSFQVYIDSSMASCIRVRFGWSSGAKNKYFEANNTDAFEKRTEQSKPVIRSPWIYFMMLGANYNIDSNGKMTFLIKGVSVAQAYLEKAKFLMNGTVLQGLPEDIWTVLYDSINNANDGTIILVNKTGDPKYKDSPDQDFFNYQNKPIKLSSLYEEPMIYIDNTGNEKRSLHFKSLRQLLCDYVNLLSSKYIDYDGFPIPVQGDQIADMSQVHHVEKPDFYVDKKYTGKDQVNYIHLYYRSPNPKSQDYIRVYSWKDSKNSIIKNFSVATDSDFAQMNAPISIKDEEGELHQINLSSISASEDGMDINVNMISNLTADLETQKGKLGFVSADVFKSGNYSTPYDFVASFVQNLNDNVFKGTIDLLLDPFYLFDKNLLPYQYLIKIEVNTPSRYTKTGEYVSGGSSYLSGYYMISKITHTINNSGATTTLDVVKFPEVRKMLSDEQLKEKKTAVDKKVELKALETEVNNSREIATSNQIEINKNEDELRRLRTIKDPAPQIQKQIEGLEERNKTLKEANEQIKKKVNELQPKLMRY